MTPAYEATEDHDSRTPVVDHSRVRHCVDMRGRWLVIGALLAPATGCGDASSEPADVRATYDGPVVKPTAVPGAAGTVRSTEGVRVTDDGSGPWLCWSPSIELGGRDPQGCADARVTGWDWDTAGDSTVDGGVRSGWYTLTGTFDGETFDVAEVSAPPGPPSYEFEIPCPTPEGGWQVVDAARVSQDDYFAATAVAQALDGFATTAVSTPDGKPGPRDPADTVVSVYVAGGAPDAEAAIREVWGGMLCVTEVARTEEEMEAIQQSLLDLPGWSQIGAGSPSNQVEMAVFHDDGRYQQWVDQEYGAGVVVVRSNLQPVG